MKKLIYCAAALATALFAGSCQRELLDPAAEGNTVTYTVNMPEVATKAGESNLLVDKLVYAVYRVENSNTSIEDAMADLSNKCEFVYQYEQDVTGTRNIVSLELINNQRYVVAFWAQKDDKWFTHTNNTTDDKGATEYKFAELGINLTNYNPNILEYDAFTGVDFIEVNGSASKNIELKRPFAQLNIATNLPKTFTAGVNTTKVTVHDVARSYNVVTNVATVDEVNPVVFKATSPLATDYPSYDKYISMNYVFVPEDRVSVTVSYEIETEAHGTVTNTIDYVPLARNYKTNIVGNLLTSKVDYTVDIINDWGRPDYEIKVWDGETISAPVYNEETKTYSITDGSELAWLAAAVNGTLPAETKATVAGDSFAGKTFVLTNDVNLGDAEWTPIGGTKHFEGTFDGQGHVISNMRITKGVNGAGLFRSIAGNVTIKNVTIEKASVVYPGQGDFYGSALVGTAYGNVTIEDVTVRDSYISGNNKVAGILAHDGVMKSLTIDDCHVEGCVIESLNQEDGGNVAGLVGLYQTTAEATIQNSSVKNTVINGINSTNTGKRSNGEFIACISGKDNLVVNIIDCEVSGNTFTQNEGVTYVSPYGVFVGGNRDDNGKGTVIVDGKHMIEAGFTKEGHNIEVSNASHFLKAIAMVEDYDVITLLGDVTFNEANRSDNGGWWDGLAYSGDKSFTVDLNSFTINQNGALNDYLVWLKNDGTKANTITFKNGTMDAGKTAYCALCTASSHVNKLTVNLENITLINEKLDGSAVKIRAGSELNVKDGTKITGQNSYLGIECSASIVNIFDGAEIYMNGTGSYNGCLVGVGGNGTINVYGGYGKGVKGGFIAMTSGGTINVNGGEWIANTDGSIGNNSNLYVLTAQSNSLESGFAGGSYINVTGGTLRGGMDAWVLDASKPEEQAGLCISGGNFNANPTRYLADGCEAHEAEGIWTVRVSPVAKIGEVEYETLEDAVAAAKANETITVLRDVTLSEDLTLPAGIIFNGNGKQINGTIYAGGDITFAGHTKVTLFSASYYNRTITIGEGACLEVTSTGRVTLGYGNTFNITGSIENAKTADKANINPSLIIPGGISITGGNDAAMNVTNAYVTLGNTSSKNSAANGEFTWNINNSIVDFTNQFTLSEPTNGMNPKFIVNVENSVLTTVAKFCIAAPNSTINVKNSSITTSNNVRNSGTINLTNGSTLSGYTIQFSENGGNDGTINVDASKLYITATSTGHAFDGKESGKIILKNRAEATVTYYKDMTITNDETCTFTGTKVQ